MSTRKIIDPKQNGEKVWLKGHAKAIYMSDGSTVEDVINNIEIPSLDDYVTETELNDKGFLTEHQDISHLASRNWVESQGYAHQEDLLEISFNDIQDSPISIDDSGMINFVDESGNVGFQINEEGLRVTDVIAGDHKLSEKANISDIPSLDGYAKTEDIPSLDGLVKSEDLPSFDEFAKTSDIPNLDGYAKTEDIPSLDDYASKEWVNNKNYATEYDLKTIDYSSINNIPTLEDETGELNITDESGNIGMKVASEAVYAKDFVAGEHKLSEKADKTYVDNSIAELVGSGDITIGGGGSSSGKQIVVCELQGTGGIRFNEHFGAFEPNKIYIYNDALIDGVDIELVTPPSEDYAEYSLIFTIGYPDMTYISTPYNWCWAKNTSPSDLFNSVEEETHMELSVTASKVNGEYVYRACLTAFDKSPTLDVNPT